MKFKKGINWLLAIVLMSVWSKIGYDIIVGMSGETSDESKSETVMVRPRQESVFIYVPNVRNPFLLHERTQHIVRKRENPGTIVNNDTLWVPPPYKLIGIIYNQKERLAILETQDGSSILAREGETVSTLTIVGIFEKSVKYSYNGREQEWKLE